MEALSVDTMGEAAVTGAMRQMPSISLEEHQVEW